MAWWENNRMRMVQNNLRDVDGAMDVAALVEELKAFEANTVMVGASGITTFFEGGLESDTPSPYLQGDKLGEIIRACHAAGIRVIVRFDFSKTHEHLFEKHPDWYYRGLDGNIVRYNDTVQTCINGPYQQRRSLEMIDEVLERYPVDGIFFNMFGYTTRDYSGVYHGICQCENCKRRFFEATGMTLPVKETEGDPVFERYKRFKLETSAELLKKIRALVASKGRDIAVCTYSTDFTDMVRSESNSAVDRPLPMWLYSASENCQVIRDSYPGQIACNCAINAVDIFYRFQGVSPHLTRMRLYENMAAGSGLDYCIIGAFEGYPDRAGMEAAKEVFRFHARHERYYGALRSLARVALLKPLREQTDQYAYRGMYRILKEAHILFDVMTVERLEREPSCLDGYALILAPEIRKAGPCAMDALAHVKGKLLTTGAFLSDTEQGKALMRRMFGIAEIHPAPPVRSWYVETTPKALFTDFAERDWVFVDEPLAFWDVADEKATLLPMVAPAPYGPPERCFGHTVTAHPGVVMCEGGHRVAFSFAPDRLYDRYGYEDHKNLLLDVMRALLPKQDVKLQGPACVEMFADRLPDGALLVQLINQSGFNGSTFFAPGHVRGIEIDVGSMPQKVTELCPEGERALPPRQRMKLDMEGAYRAFVFRFAASD